MTRGRTISAYTGMLLAGALALPGAAHAQAAPAMSSEDRAAIEAELRELQQARHDFDARIEALEQRLGMPDPAAAPQASGAAPAPRGEGEQDPGNAVTIAGADLAAAPGQLAAAEPERTSAGVAGWLERQEQVGRFDPEVGWVLVDEPKARLNLGLMTYARYLNQEGLDSTYVDSFGRTLPIDIRNEVQLYKVSLQFKGWLFDPRFSHLLFIWTNNANQGEGGQVAIAGFLRYKFADELSVSAGIMPLPTTRSTNYSFPKWLRHDNRPMADEFYRGSYTSGIDVLGEIAPGLTYRAMIGNNLSTLGVSSKELDDKFDTISGSLTWMPTTGEFGLANGFGDYDYHDRVATLLAVYASQSTETAQGQPSLDDFENSQIRLSDGTLLFSPDPFGTGGKIEEARWQMASIDAGIKYRGFSLEAQYYWRNVDNFVSTGFIPVDNVRDQGMVVQASAMPIRDVLQAYVTYSKIWGDYGDPSEWGFGLNYYPFRRREMHINIEALKLDHSPVGGYHMPIPVGGNGWVFLSDWVVMF